MSIDYPHTVLNANIIYSTSETKALKRKRMIEYRKRGKTDKYYRLREELENKLKKSAENFLKKNMDSLKETNPSKAYSILKRMGAHAPLILPKPLIGKIITS